MEIEQNVRREFCSHSFDLMRYFVIEFLAEYFLVQDVWTSVKCITTNNYFIDDGDELSM